jgi:Fibronectin type III domain
VPGTRHRSPLAARVVPALVAVALLTGTGASVARASFRGTAAASTTVGSSTVTPPTGLTAGPCTGRHVLLTWTPSTWPRTVTTYAVHYTVGSVPGTASLPANSTRDTTTVTVSGLQGGVRYVFAVSTLTPSTWSSADSNTVSVQC